MVSFRNKAHCFCNRYGLNELNLAYTPAWETLAEALARLVAAGQTEADAKRDLCRAIADGAIIIELVLAANPRQNLPEDTVPPAGLTVPRRILPTDIDWKISRPIKPWPLAKRPFGESPILYGVRVGNHVDRTIKTIMVQSSDVSKLLGPIAQAASKPTQDRPRPKSGSGTKFQGVEEAIRELWPDGAPKGLATKDRNKKIIERLKSRGLSVPHERTIQRAAQKIQNEPSKTD